MSSFLSALLCKGNKEELSGPRRSVCNCTSAGSTIGGALNVKKRPNEKTTLAFSLYP